MWEGAGDCNSLWWGPPGDRQGRRVKQVFKDKERWQGRWVPGTPAFMDTPTSCYESWKGSFLLGFLSLATKRLLEGYSWGEWVTELWLFSRLSVPCKANVTMVEGAQNLLECSPHPPTWLSAFFRGDFPSAGSLYAHPWPDHGHYLPVVTSRS